MSLRNPQQAACGSGAMITHFIDEETEAQRRGEVDSYSAFDMEAWWPKAAGGHAGPLLTLRLPMWQASLASAGLGHSPLKEAHLVAQPRVGTSLGAHHALRSYCVSRA